MTDTSDRGYYTLLVTDPAAALRDVTARRELHWARHHPGQHPDQDFADCALCGVLDSQERRALHAIERDAQ